MLSNEGYEFPATIGCCSKSVEEEPNVPELASLVLGEGSIIAFSSMRHFLRVI
jgi:hypothetical protein